MQKYGLASDQQGLSESEHLLKLEMEMIRRGGRWGAKNQHGCGLLQHYLNAHKLLWPEDIQHRWFVLGMKSLVENQITVMMGAANATKSYILSVHALITYWSRPETFLGLVSSTDMRSLELRIWGRGIKWLFNRARSRFPDLPGNVLESKMAISTHDIDDDGDMARQLNVGLVCVPCVSGGRFIGLSKFQGIKPPSSPGKNDGILAVYGDELATMQPSYLDVFSNFVANKDCFKAGLSGNPTDISDPLCMAGEPVEGWDSFNDTEKTQEWKSRWYDAHVIAFDGRDTPNNEPPKDRLKFLTSSDHVQTLEKTHGKDSWQVFTMGIGKPSRGMVSNRVITIGLCERHKAFDDVVWKGTSRTQIYGIDPAYGGGDRCVGGTCEFGEDINGQIVFCVHEPEIIPIRLSAEFEPADQIAEYVKARCAELNIPPEQMAYDSVGKGVLGFSFAKVFGSNCPIPIDSGMMPTERPVRFDLYVDEKNGLKRLKTCREHYSKFVTEMWFSSREAIESGQVRNLPKSVAQEGQMRLFRIVAGNKIEVETKDDMKERIKKSPDLYDWFCVCLELARRLGFKIERIGRDVPSGKPDDDSFFDKEAKEWDNAIEAGLIRH